MPLKKLFPLSFSWTYNYFFFHKMTLLVGEAKLFISVPSRICSHHTCLKGRLHQLRHNEHKASVLLTVLIAWCHAPHHYVWSSLCSSSPVMSLWPSNPSEILRFTEPFTQCAYYYESRLFLIDFCFLVIVTAVIKKKKEADLFQVFVLYSLWSKFNRKGEEHRIHKSIHSEIHQSTMVSLRSINFSTGNVLLVVIYPHNQADCSMGLQSGCLFDGVSVTTVQRPIRIIQLPTLSQGLKF